MRENRRWPEPREPRHADVEASLTWQRAAACSSSTCVEVAVVRDGVLVRDSKNPGVVLEFTDAEWSAFSAGVAAGEFDLPRQRHG